MNLTVNKNLSFKSGYVTSPERPDLRDKPTKDLREKNKEIGGTSIPLEEELSGERLKLVGPDSANFSKYGKKYKIPNSQTHEFATAIAKAGIFPTMDSDEKAEEFVKESLNPTKKEGLLNDENIQEAMKIFENLTSKEKQQKIEKWEELINYATNNFHRLTLRGLEDAIEALEKNRETYM